MIHDDFDDPTATDLRSRRFRALRQAGRSLAAAAEDAAALVKSVQREIRKHGGSSTRQDRLHRARERLAACEKHVEEHNAKVQRYLVAPGESPVADKPERKRNHAAA